MSSPRKILEDAQLVVVKIGSTLLTGRKGLNHASLKRLCRQIASIHALGKSVLVVSSGAIAEGSFRLGFKKRPKTIHDLQASAAVGQIGLTAEYQRLLHMEKIQTALILLTHEDLKDRLRYLNARQTIQSLLARNVVPVVNENDTISTEEIQFGDNDTLAARVASLVQADVLVLLTNQPGFLEADPSIDPSAKLVSEAFALDDSLERMAGGSSGELGRGGMITKLKAARFAAHSGCHTVIADGRHPQTLVDILKGQDVGTLLKANIRPLVARKQWIAGQLNVAGSLVVDQGAEAALKNNGVSLLAVGISGVDGEFSRGSLVSIVSTEGQRVAQGFTNYDSAEIRQIQGQSSDEIAGKLGYINEPEIIHRDNMALVAH